MIEKYSLIFRKEIMTGVGKETEIIPARPDLGASFMVDNESRAQLAQATCPESTVLKLLYDLINDRVLAEKEDN